MLKISQKQSRIFGVVMVILVILAWIIVYSFVTKYMNAVANVNGATTINEIQFNLTNKDCNRFVGAVLFLISVHVLVFINWIKGLLVG